MRRRCGANAIETRGKFDDAGLVPDVRNLKPSDVRRDAAPRSGDICRSTSLAGGGQVLGIWEWADFYRKHETYRAVGVLNQLYYDARGAMRRAAAAAAARASVCSPITRTRDGRSP